MSTVYSIADVAKHDKKTDLWVIIHDKVYDITSFVPDHPGGGEVLFEEAGKDATDAFEDIGHSDLAREILEKYYIGELEEKSRKAKSPTAPPVTNVAEAKSSGISWSVVIPAVVIGGILLYKFVLAPQKQ